MRFLLVDVVGDYDLGHIAYSQGILEYDSNYATQYEAIFQHPVMSTIYAIGNTDWSNLDETQKARLVEYSTLEAAGWFVDPVTMGIAVYSLRRAVPSYAGKCIRVRRTSDNAEQDIDFTASTGFLDEAALTSFVGANSAYVTTWYDQSGNGYNATNTNAASQPQIVASGSVIKSRTGRPKIRFYYMELSASLPNNTTYYVSSGSWSDSQLYQITTESSGNTFIPSGKTNKYQGISGSELVFYAESPELKYLQDLRVLYQNDLDSTDIFRIRFSTSAAKTLSLTTSGSAGVTFIDKTGTQADSYSRTVAAFDWLNMRSTNPQNITVINWGSKTLHGEISCAEFEKMTGLTSLTLTSNDFTGKFPNLAQATGLTAVAIQGNHFTGPLPSLSSNTSLLTLYVSNNQLSGSIPSLSNNTLLTGCNLNGNLFTGNIPDLSNNTALTSFDCSVNQLTGWVGGTVSVTLGSFSALNNLLDAATVNALLAAFVSAGKNSGTRILNLGGTNAAPTGQGLTDKATLQGRGWTVTTN